MRSKCERVTESHTWLRAGSLQSRPKHHLTLVTQQCRITYRFTWGYSDYERFRYYRLANRDPMKDSSSGCAET